MWLTLGAAATVFSFVGTVLGLALSFVLFVSISFSEGCIAMFFSVIFLPSFIVHMKHINNYCKSDL